MTLHRSPITCAYLLSTALIPPEMSLIHMEDAPLRQPSLQGAQGFWTPRLLSMAALLLLLLLFCIAGGLSFALLKSTTKEPCMVKFGPLPSKWQVTSPESPCMNMTSDWKLKILHTGSYLIYGEVAFNKAYEGHAPFIIQLRKNEDNLRNATSRWKNMTSEPHIQFIGGTYEFHAGDIIDLRFNDEDQIKKNSTYWVVLLVPDLQFIS
ncbi:tumor necrosis factor ligand superfamily member 18 [Nannospalax galili]|uniref:tumor necrosis factor ligand superfamily member 18 n=1 Tax=Nannospalax galili TaxID=1026970 RepID=UPI0004ED1158|nr:tumor necrosis factor ligand superfamily member 18 [Nannospalax galili]